MKTYLVAADVRRLMQADRAEADRRGSDCRTGLERHRQIGDDHPVASRGSPPSQGGYIAGGPAVLVS